MDERVGTVAGLWRYEMEEGEAVVESRVGTLRARRLPGAGTSACAGLLTSTTAAGTVRIGEAVAVGARL